MHQKWTSQFYQCEAIAEAANSDITLQRNEHILQVHGIIAQLTLKIGYVASSK